jgi:hypothetical protein
VNKACIPAADIGDVTTAPPDDPRRRHLATCPHCRALAREYQAFMNPGPLPPEARPDWASAAISQRLAREIRPPGGVILPLFPRRSRLGLPRALWAAAGALVVCAGISLVRDVNRDLQPQVPYGTALLRGDAATPAALLVTPLAGSPGAWQLAWSLPADAQASVVVLYDTTLRELGRRDLGRTATLTLDPQAWPHAAQAAYVGVIFLRRGEEIQRAAARALAAD